MSLIPFKINHSLTSRLIFLGLVRRSQIGEFGTHYYQIEWIWFAQFASHESNLRHREKWFVMHINIHLLSLLELDSSAREKENDIHQNLSQITQNLFDPIVWKASRTFHWQSQLANNAKRDIVCSIPATYQSNWQIVFLPPFWSFLQVISNAILEDSSYSVK
jgi:hypothetical protein